MDYNTGKIYRIYNPHVEFSLEYIGSTASPLLSTRMAIHRATYRAGKGKCCNSSKLFDKYGVENCIIELIENYPCKDKHELNRREGHFIQERHWCVNRYVAGRTGKESSAAYRKNNKEKVTEAAQQKYQATRESKLAAQKKYYENHREEVLAYHAEYNNTNRDKNNARQRAYYLRKKNEKNELINPAENII